MCAAQGQIHRCEFAEGREQPHECSVSGQAGHGICCHPIPRGAECAEQLGASSLQPFAGCNGPQACPSKAMITNLRRRFLNMWMFLIHTGIFYTRLTGSRLAAKAIFNELGVGVSRGWGRHRASCKSPQQAQFGRPALSLHVDRCRQQKEPKVPCFGLGCRLQP